MGGGGWELLINGCKVPVTQDKSWGVLYNTVPTVNNTVLFTQKLVMRVDFMLNVLTSILKNNRENKSLWKPQ